MKEGSKNSIEELFKTKIEEAEVEPGKELTRHFMRRLERKEFMRFNFARFNVWYLGTIAAALTVVGVILLPVDNNSESKVSSDNNTKLTDSINIPDSISVKSSDSVSVLPEIKSESSNYNAGKLKTKQPETNVRREVPVLTSGESDRRQTNVSTVSEESLKESPLLMAKINASVTQGCVPLQVKFLNGSSSDAVSLWTFGDGGISSEREPEWIFNVAGSYKVTLAVSDENGHSAFTTVIINVWPKPEAAFDIMPADPSIPGDEITFTNNSSGASSYKWHFGDGTTSNNEAPAHKYGKYGKYDVSLVAVSEFGCVDSLSISDAFSDTDCYIRFPNAFTPNKGGPTGGYYTRMTDNGNLVFHPVYSGVIKYNLKIYSKQGYLVFESDDVYLGWDGYYKGQLCSSGVYIWKAEGKFRDGENYVMSGDVTLVNY